MGGGGDIENGHGDLGIGKDVEHRGVEGAGVNDGGLSRFDPEFLEMVAFAGLDEEAREEVAIVVGFGDPVSAAEVEGADGVGGEEFAELAVDGIEGGGEILAALFAEGVEVEAGDAVEVGVGEEFRRRAESGTRAAGIVEGRVSGGAAGVDAEAAAESAVQEAWVGGDAVSEAVPLTRGVEIEVMGDREEGVDVGVGVGRRAGEDVLGEMGVGEGGLPRTGGAAAVEILGQNREDLGHGEGLEGVGHVASGGRFDAGEDLAVGADAGEIDDEGGGWDGHGGVVGGRTIVESRGCGGRGGTRVFLSSVRLGRWVDGAWVPGDLVPPELWSASDQLQSHPESVPWSQRGRLDIFGRMPMVARWIETSCDGCWGSWIWRSAQRKWWPGGG